MTNDSVKISSKDVAETTSVFSKKVFLNTLYHRQRPKGFVSSKPTMTQQQFAYEADLNNLVDKNLQYKDPAFVTKLQLMGRKQVDMPIYGDFTNVATFQDAQNTLIKAKEDFMTLPAQIRKRFDNDPKKLLAFVSDSNNYDEGVSLGLFKPVQPVPTPIINDKIDKIDTSTASTGGSSDVPEPSA